MYINRIYKNEKNSKRSMVSYQATTQRKGKKENKRDLDLESNDQL